MSDLSLINFSNDHGQQILIQRKTIVHFAGPAYEMMRKCGLREKQDGSINFFPTINDAVHQAMDHITTLNVITGTI